MDLEVRQYFENLKICLVVFNGIWYVNGAIYSFTV